MPMDNEEFLKKAFAWHYARKKIPAPPFPEQREFGTGSYGKKIDKRHISFKDEESFNKFLVAEAPMFISYSCAYYRRPSATPMGAKGFLGADLIYEFDADDFNEECVQEHDSWECKKCGAKGKGAPEKCSSCGAGVSVEQWVCDKCLGKAKENVFNLLGILQDDFGIEDGISINFSGSKGYHMHVRSENVRKLSSKARIELVDYLTGNQLNPESLGFYYDAGKFYSPKEKTALGWQRKILLRMKKLFSASSHEELSLAAGIASSTAKRILNEGSIILNGINMGFLPSVYSKNEKFWNSIISYCVSKESLPIDRQTSVDIRKIVRTPETLHGSTGLNASVVEMGRLKEFDPLKDSIVFSEKPVNVKVASAPKFSLNGKSFGPFKEETLELPMYAGIYLIARNSAEVL